MSVKRKLYQNLKFNTECDAITLHGVSNVIVC